MCDGKCDSLSWHKIDSCCWWMWEAEIVSLESERSTRRQDNAVGENHKSERSRGAGEEQWDNKAGFAGPRSALCHGGKYLAVNRHSAQMWRVHPSQSMSAAAEIWKWVAAAGLLGFQFWNLAHLANLQKSVFLVYLTIALHFIASQLPFSRNCC